MPLRESAYEPEQEETVDESLTSEKPELEFGFRYFKLHIDTPNNEESVIAEYYGDSAITDAIYKNMHAAADVQGDAAYTLLKQVFAELQLTQDTSKEEVINQVTQAFDATDYTNFELEIEYEDGETKNHTSTANNKKNQVGVFIDLVFLIPFTMIHTFNLPI